jgi:hypothetical protein
MNILLDANALFPAILGALVGGLLTWVVVTKSVLRTAAQQSASQLAALDAEREKLNLRHADQLRALELRHDDQLKKVESPLTVTVHPFVDAAEDKSLFKKSTTLEVGYKYQLMVQGIPCMEPHRVVVETQTKVELDDQAIRAFSEKALALAEAAANIKGGGAGALISVAKTVVLGRK